MTAIELAEVERANDLYRQHQEMLSKHLDRKGPWDDVLHNQMLIQMQVAWPIIYRSLKGDQ